MNSKQMAELVEALKEDSKAIEDSDKVALIRKWILGNGDWESGLLSRMVVLEKKVVWLYWLIGILITAVLGQSVMTLFK